MRIAYIGNFSRSWCTEVHVAESLRSLGQDVIELQEDGLSWPSVPFDVERADVELLLWTRTWHTDLDVGRSVLAELAELSVPTVGFHLDRWWGLDREYQIKDEPYFSVDMLFTADGGHDERWQAAGIDHHWLPPGIVRSEAVVGTRQEQLASRVAFVGSYPYPHSQWDYRNTLIEKTQQRYQRSFRIWPQRGQAIRGSMLSDLYASVPVLIGDSCLAGDVTHYWSDRIPETLGRGGFLIHPYVEGIEDWYTDREHLVFYELGDFDGLFSLVDYYLRHDRERAEIAAAGRDLVLRRDTYDQRMSELLRIVTSEHEAFRPVAGRSGDVTVRSPGVPPTKFTLRPDSWDGTTIDETWRENVYRLSKSDVEGKTIVDVGANIGAFSLWAAKAGAAKVLAAEPEPSNYEQLVENLASNSIDGIIGLANVAVMSRNGTALLTVDGANSSIAAHATDKTVSVDAVTLDELLVHLLHVDVLKVDTEGSEYPMFEGCSSETLDKIDRIVCEWHPGPIGRLVERLLSWGNVELMGRPERGGYLFGMRYGA